MQNRAPRSAVQLWASGGQNPLALRRPPPFNRLASSLHGPLHTFPARHARRTRAPRWL